LNIGLDSLVAGTGDLYTYTVSSSNQSSVAAEADRTAASADPITHVYTNPTLENVTITYTITPYAAGTSCAGNTFTYTVTVNPALTATTCVTADNCQLGNGNIQVNIVGGTKTYTVDMTGRYTTTTNTGDINTAVFNPDKNTKTTSGTETSVTYPNLPGNATYKIKVTDSKACIVGETH
ncbi:MAG: hypothetical protein LW630_05680, partial [Saprospiraceae bacterium]|nr:hypothetical protein [Saprospiraceae bacterium]